MAKTEIVKAIIALLRAIIDLIDDYIYMNDEEKAYILDGHTVAEKKVILDTIKANETAKNTSYRIDFEDGYYEVDNGEVINMVKGEETEDGKMSQSVRSFLIAGHSDEEKEELLQEIEAAENAGKTEYDLHFENGYYRIKNGQIVGGARWGK